MPEEVKGQGFVIKDRRTFDSHGDAKINTEDTIKEEPKRDKEGKEAGPLPEVDFSSFILSLSSSVLLHLGEIADPVSGENEKYGPGKTIN